MKINRVQRDVFIHLLSELDKAGVAPRQLFSEIRQRGVTLSDTSQAVVAGPDAMILLEAAVDLTGDPCLALRLGQRVGITSYGSFGFALMSCASLRESVRLLLRYGQAFFQPTWIAYEHEGGMLLRANIARGTAAQQQLVTELCFSNLNAVGRSLYGSQVEAAQGVELHLSYPRPAHSDCYKSAFNVPVTFDCEFSQLLLPAQVLDTPVKTANRSEHVVFHQQCEELLRGLNSVEKTTSAVRQVLIQSAGDFFDIAEVAESLNMSERTLRRHLEAESTSFRSICDEIRNLLSKEYLVATELTVADIAHLLGYSETVNFRRAFVRWNEITPIEYREEHMVGTKS